MLPLVTCGLLLRNSLFSHFSMITACDVVVYFEEIMELSAQDLLRSESHLRTPYQSIPALWSQFPYPEL